MAARSAEDKALDREIVRGSLQNRKDVHEGENRSKVRNGQVVDSPRYIHPNQESDAGKIVDLFRTHRVVSVLKKTKIGMNGLMIEVAARMCTHPDDDFVVPPENVRILTGMSNAKWGVDFKEYAYNALAPYIFHHGQLHKANLDEMRDALIIVDEIDTGDAVGQRLQQVMADLLNIERMVSHNIRILFASATLMQELKDLNTWGDAIHCNYKMEIPRAYVGHSDFLKHPDGLIREFYKLNTPEMCAKWLDEDILGRYGTAHRIHLVRVQTGAKGTALLHPACAERGIEAFEYMTGTEDRHDALAELFERAVRGKLAAHVVVMVKGHLRRANEIPNSWKMQIGAVMEYHTANPDTSVQIQGLVGRMTGYWRAAIEGGHLTGPYRTSINAIEEYERAFESSDAPYSTARKETMLDPAQVGLTEERAPTPQFKKSIDVFATMAQNDEHAKKLGNKEKSGFTQNEALFWQCHLPVLKGRYDSTAAMKREGFLGEGRQVQPLADLQRYLALQTAVGLSHSRGMSLDEVPVGACISRKYVAYSNLKDPASAQFFTLAFHRIN